MTKTHQKIDYEKIWQKAFIACLVFSLIYAVNAYSFCKDEETSQICQLEWNDTAIIITVIIIVGGIRWIFYESLKELVRKHFFDSLLEEQGKMKSLIFCKWVFDIFQYSALTVLEYLVLRNTDYLPKIYLGSGDISKTFDNYPNSDNLPYGKEFIVLSIGVHSVSLITQLIGKGHNKKFYEFLLHHFMAQILLIFALITNCTRIGVLTLACHDIGDAFLSLCRAVIETKLKKIQSLTMIVIISTFIIWVYSRLFAYPFYICWESNKFFFQLLQSTDSRLSKVKYFYFVQNSMGLILLCMHIYWTIPMLKYCIAHAKSPKQSSVYYETPQIVKQDEADIMIQKKDLNDKVQITEIAQQ